MSFLFKSNCQFDEPAVASGGREEKSYTPCYKEYIVATHGV